MSIIDKEMFKLLIYEMNKLQMVNFNIFYTKTVL